MKRPETHKPGVGEEDSTQRDAQRLRLTTDEVDESVIFHPKPERLPLLTLPDTLSDIASILASANESQVVTAEADSNDNNNAPIQVPTDSPSASATDAEEVRLDKEQSNERRPERSDSKSITLLSHTTDNRSLVASLLLSPTIPTLCDSLRPSQSSKFDSEEEGGEGGRWMQPRQRQAGETAVSTRIGDQFQVRRSDERSESQKGLL